MPSFGLKQKLSVLGVAGRLCGASIEQRIRRHDVWLWSCHGPGGEPAGSERLRQHVRRRTASAATAPALTWRRRHARVARRRATHDASRVVLESRTNTALSAVRVQRAATVARGRQVRAASVAAHLARVLDRRRLRRRGQDLPPSPRRSPATPSQLKLSCTARLPRRPGVARRRPRRHEGRRDRLRRLAEADVRRRRLAQPARPARSRSTSAPTTAASA